MCGSGDMLAGSGWSDILKLGAQMIPTIIQQTGNGMNADAKQALLNHSMKEYKKIYINLIYVLLATVADVMPLRKINRIIAKKILENFDITKNYIFREIYKINNKKIFESIKFYGNCEYSKYLFSLIK